MDILLPRLILTTALAFALSIVGLPKPSYQQAVIHERNDTSWDSYVNEFLEAYFAAHPDFAVTAGRHEFDGKLPDWSAEGFAREIKRLRSEKERATRFKDSKLDEQQRLERDYVLTVIDADLFWLSSAEWPFRCPQYYAGGIDPDVYVSRNYAPLDQRLRAYTAYAKAIPRALDQIRRKPAHAHAENVRRDWPHNVWRLGFIL